MIVNEYLIDEGHGQGLLDAMFHLYAEIYIDKAPCLWGLNGWDCDYGVDMHPDAENPAECFTHPCEED